MSSASLTPKEMPSGDEASGLMGPKVIIGLILIGLFSFSALITLLGYSGDLKDNNNGRAHVLSNSAIGFAGLRILLQETGYTVELDANEQEDGRYRYLRVFTLNSTYQTDKLNDIDPASPSLIVLPKWNVFPIAKSPGWVEASSVNPLRGAENLSSNLEALMGTIDIKRAQATDNPHNTSFYFLNNGPVYALPITRLQSFAFPKADIATDSKQESEKTSAENSQSEIEITPLITINETGDFILARVNETNTYILSDPDFLNTHGLVKKRGAQFALELLDSLKQETATLGYVFDLSLHGIGGRRNMVKLFTQPPFLSLTILVMALLALLGWQAFIRFGDPKHGSLDTHGDDLQMGPQSLAKTTADILRITNREAELMPTYAHHIRQQALSLLGFSGRGQSDHIKALTQRELNKGLTPNFETLHKKAKAVTHKEDVVQVAQALQTWKKGIIK